MRVADGRVVRRIPSADPREHFSSAPATACGSHDVPPAAASGKAVAGPSLHVSMRSAAAATISRSRGAPPFLHASERRRVQASDARPGRGAVVSLSGAAARSPPGARVPILKGSWRRSGWPAILIFWRLSGASERPKWLARAKSRATASVYGTEGQRFESSRARFVTQQFVDICRAFVSRPGVSGSWLGSS